MLRQMAGFGAAEALARGLNWLLILVLSMVLEIEVFGALALVLALEQIAASVIFSGPTRALLRFQSQSSSDHDTDILAQTQAARAVCILFALPVFGLILAGYWSIPELLGVESLVVLGGLFAFVLSRGALHMQSERARARADLKSFFVLKPIVQALRFAALLPVIHASDPVVMFLATSTLVHALATLYGSLSSGARTLVSVRPALVRSVALFSLPLAFHSVSGLVLSWIDRYMIHFYTDKTQVGLYSATYILGSALTFVTAIATQYYEPFIYSSAQGAAQIRLWHFRMCTAIVLIQLALSAVILGGVHMAGLWGMDGASRYPAELLAIILLSHVLLSFMSIAHIELLNRRSSAWIGMASFLAAILNVGLNVMLIPAKGLIGAAEATFWSMLLLSAVTTWAAVGRSWRTHPMGLAMILTAIVSIAFMLQTNRDLLSALGMIALSAGVLLAYLAFIEVRGRGRLAPGAFQSAADTPGTSLPGSGSA